MATARLIFTSSKTAEVKVDVDEVRLARGEGLQPLKQRAVESVLTCLALDDNFQPRDMKPLIVGLFSIYLYQIILYYTI